MIYLGKLMKLDYRPSVGFVVDALNWFDGVKNRPN